MSTENIKIGEIYNVRVKVIGITKDGVDALYVDADGGGITGLRIGKERIGMLRLSTPETAPKYDPNRPFRKGDIVEPSKINGRLPQELLKCYRYEVIIGEGEMSNPLYVTVKPLLAGNYKHISDIHVNVAFLKLVTPVEELEPYMVKELKDSFIVYHDCTKIVLNGTSLVCKFMKASHPNAKAAAEAECERLNAEYRKEQK